MTEALAIVKNYFLSELDKVRNSDSEIAKFLVSLAIIRYLGLVKEEPFLRNSFDRPVRFDLEALFTNLAGNLSEKGVMPTTKRYLFDTSEANHRQVTSDNYAVPYTILTGNCFIEETTKAIADFMDECASNPVLHDTLVKKFGETLPVGLLGENFDE